MAKKSTNSTIFTVGILAVVGYVSYKVLPKLLKKLSGSGGSGGAAGAANAYSPWGQQYQGGNSRGAGGLNGDFKGQNSSDPFTNPSPQESISQALANGDYTSQNQGILAGIFDLQQGYAFDGSSRSDESDPDYIGTTSNSLNIGVDGSNLGVSQVDAGSGRPGSGFSDFLNSLAEDLGLTDSASSDQMPSGSILSYADPALSLSAYTDLGGVLAGSDPDGNSVDGQEDSSNQGGDNGNTDDGDTTSDSDQGQGDGGGGGSTSDLEGGVLEGDTNPDE